MAIVNCSQARALMSEQLDGRLSDTVASGLAEHIAQCTACQTRWQAMQHVARFFQDVDMALPPLDFTARVINRLTARELDRVAVRSARAQTVLAWATMACALLIVVTALVLSVSGMPSQAIATPSLDMVSLSLRASDAVVWTSLLIGSVFQVVDRLAELVPLSLLLVGTAWLAAGTGVLAYTVASLIAAYQPART